MGTHDYNALKAAYGSSPIHNDLDDQKIKELAEQLMLEGVVNDGGHTFGDSLTDNERIAILEYLKTL